MALVIDWFACSFITILVLGVERYAGTPGASWVTLGIFWAETALGTAIAGGSFGQLATRIRVFKITGGPIGLLPAMLRSLLVCLVVPPLIFKSDGRGLHDLAVGSGVYRL